MFIALCNGCKDGTLDTIRRGQKKQLKIYLNLHKIPLIHSHDEVALNTALYECPLDPFVTCICLLYLQRVPIINSKAL